MHHINRMLPRRAMLTFAVGLGLLGSTALASTAAAAPTGQLGLSMTAPATAEAGTPFAYTIKLVNQGPAQSTTTTLTDQLPADTTLIGFNHSQGTCASSGSPSKVVCAIGTLAKSANATVTIIVTAAKAESITNTATATNAEGATSSAAATTVISSPPAAGTAPQATTTGDTAVKNAGAELLGTVDPGNQSTGYFFEIGTNTSYGTTTPIGHTGTTKMSVNATVAGLKAGTTYHYRLVAINDSGTSYGADKTFKTTGSNYLGALVLRSTRLHVRGGKVYVPFTCNSTKTCTFRFTIVIHARSTKTHKIVTVVFTKSATPFMKIRAHKTVTEVVGVQSGALALLNKVRNHRLAGKLTTGPRSNQKGIIAAVTLIRG